MMRSRNTSVKPLSPAEVRDADVDPLFLVWIVSRSAEDLVGTVLAPVGLTGVQLRETTGGTGAPDPSGAPQRSALLPHPTDRGRETGAPVGGGPVRPGPGADHPGPRRPARSGPGITAPTARGHRHGPGRPAEHGGLVSTATWSPVPRNSRLRLASDDQDHASLLASPDGGVPGHVTDCDRRCAVLGLSVSGTKTRMQRPAAIQSRY